MDTIEYDKKYWGKGKCPPINCHKAKCACGLKYVNIPATLGDDSRLVPKNGDYCNAIVKYEANNHVYIYSSEGVPVLVRGDAQMAVGKPIYILEPDRHYHCGSSFVPYYYKDELKEKGNE